jgi:hypothetical protein
MSSSRSAGKGNSAALKADKDAAIAISAVVDSVFSGLGTNYPAPTDEEIRHNFTQNSFDNSSFKRYDLAGVKGNAFVVAIIKLLANAYKSGGEQHEFIASVNRYCYGHSYFESMYLGYKTSSEPLIKSTVSVIGSVANMFCADASSDKARATAVAELCVGFLAMLLVKSGFTTRTAIKGQLLPEIIRLWGQEGLFKTSPDFEREMNNIIVQVNSAAPKKTNKKADSTPTDNAGQKSNDQSSQITDLVAIVKQQTQSNDADLDSLA